MLEWGQRIKKLLVIRFSCLYLVQTRLFDQNCTQICCFIRDAHYTNTRKIKAKDGPLLSFFFAFLLE